MKDRVSRRGFLKVAGVSLGFGALYRVAPLLSAGGEGTHLARLLGRKNGERVTPFFFVQLSDTHVGFSGPPNPLGTQAFEKAVDAVNGLSQRPDLVLFTGDLTHDSEKPGEHADRMKLFQKIAGRLKVPLVKYVPGSISLSRRGRSTAGRSSARRSNSSLRRNARRSASPSSRT